MKNKIRYISVLFCISFLVIGMQIIQSFTYTSKNFSEMDSKVILECNRLILVGTDKTLGGNGGFLLADTDKTLGGNGGFLLADTDNTAA